MLKALHELLGKYKIRSPIVDVRWMGETNKRLFNYRISREAGVKRLIHFSALNASPNPVPHVYKAGSQFLKSKYFGELAVLKEFPEATIIRPADIYGFGDHFIYYYSHIWRRRTLFFFGPARGMVLWRKGEDTIKQPVWAGDVARAVSNIVAEPATAGKIYQAVGPRRYYLSDLMDWMHAEMRKTTENGFYCRWDLKYDPLFRLKVWFTHFVSPGTPVGQLHKERIERESITDEIDPKLPTLEDLGVNPALMEYRVGSYSLSLLLLTHGAILNQCIHN